MRSAMSARISLLLPLLGGRGGRVGGCGGCRRAESETFRLLFALRFLLAADADGDAACRALLLSICWRRASGARQGTVGGSRASGETRQRGGEREREREVVHGIERGSATATSKPFFALKRKPVLFFTFWASKHRTTAAKKPKNSWSVTGWASGCSCTPPSRLTPCLRCP